MNSSQATRDAELLRIVAQRAVRRASQTPVSVANTAAFAPPHGANGALGLIVERLVRRLTPRWKAFTQGMRPAASFDTMTLGLSHPASRR